MKTKPAPTFTVLFRPLNLAQAIAALTEGKDLWCHRPGKNPVQAWEEMEPLLPEETVQKDEPGFRESTPDEDATVLKELHDDDVQFLLCKGRPQPSITDKNECKIYQGTRSSLSVTQIVERE